jgi:hypothetical protein
MADYVAHKAAWSIAPLRLEHCSAPPGALLRSAWSIAPLRLSPSIPTCCTFYIPQHMSALSTVNAMHAILVRQTSQLLDIDWHGKHRLQYGVALQPNPY